MNSLNGSIAIYALTRGYTIKNKLKYRHLIKRNIAIKRIFKHQEIPKLIIFHEGNIGTLDQKMISLFSRIKLNFIEISGDFKPHPNNVWSGTSDFPIKYSLMCQFQYFHAWKYLDKFEIVIRIDEDCICKSLPASLKSEILECGGIIGESHARTNETFLNFLSRLKMEGFYDHKFPYTNVFITKPSYWLNQETYDFLYEVYSDPLSLENRWGDIPVLGVAAKKFYDWDHLKAVNNEIIYEHTSHGYLVEHGEILGPGRKVIKH